MVTKNKKLTDLAVFFVNFNERVNQAQYRLSADSIEDQDAYRKSFKK